MANPEVPPIPKSRRLTINNEGFTRTPVPLPRRTVPSAQVENNDLSTTSSLSQETNFAEDIAAKVYDSSKYVREMTISAKNKFEKSIVQGKMAKQRLEKSVRSSTRSAKDKLLSASKYLNKDDKNCSVLQVPTEERCVSMPIIDTQLFDSIQFNSPISEQNNFIPESSSIDDSSPSSSSSVSNYSNVYYRSNSSATDRQSLVSDRMSLNLSELSSFSCSNNLYDSPRCTVPENAYYESIPAPILKTKEPSPQPRLTIDAVAGSSTADNTDANRSPETGTLQPFIIRPQKVISYENWNLPKNEKETTRPSKSMIYEFDPLVYSANSTNCDKNKQLSMLESLLAGDTYGTITPAKDIYAGGSISDDSDTDLYWEDANSLINPPTPPERIDSLSKDPNVTLSVKVNEMTLNKSNLQSKQNSREDNELEFRSKSTKSDSAKHSSLSVKDRISSIWRKVPASTLKKKINHSLNNIVFIPEGIVLAQALVQHQGSMVRLVVGGMEELFNKNFQLRLYILSELKIVCYSEGPNAQSKESYPLKNMFSIQIIQNNTFNCESEVYCFQMNISNVGAFKGNRSSIVFGCSNQSECTIWTQKISESLGVKFPVEYASDFCRFGWCFLKEGVSSPWHASWLLLRKRTLHYYTENDSTVRNLDLRKARCIVLQDPEAKKLTPGEDGPNLLIDLPHVTIYLRMGVSRETKTWFGVIRRTACMNGSLIHHQQLTKGDIPTIVDKCINFVYAQGSLSEGIYRKAGSMVAVKTLLQRFRNNAWAVQLSRVHYTEHDVATTLKRFFRDLPEPLLTSKLHLALCSVHDLPCEDEKISLYREFLYSLDSVTRNTIKKLLGHLHFIQTLHEENLMTSSNLAAVWGPTLMTCPESNELTWSRKEADVVKDLIDFYLPIYKPSAKDIDSEKKMLAVLRKCQGLSTSIPLKPSGDLHVWIYINDKASGDCVNILLKPNKTSGEICIELSSKIQKDAHSLLIEEVICGESMYRPLHHTELLLDVVLRWGYWEERDRRDNYLVLKDNGYLRCAALVLNIPSNEVLLPMETHLLSGDYKFASNKSKTFKTHFFAVTRECLSYYKDKTCSAMLGSWPIDNIRWYVGHESKRNPMAAWSLTFIEKNNKPVRNKEKPYFGYTIASSIKDEEMKFIAILLHAEFTGDILPTPQLIFP